MMEKETYRECMRNHAATLGTFASDGCGEYTSDPSTPGGLQCAACGCHRNFHRKIPPLSTDTTGVDSLMLAYSSPSASAEDRTPEGKRRARTRFSTEQKEKMLQFAEKIGWRIPRRDGNSSGEEVARFCREIGVGRQVFKVWMHNHKSNSGSRSSSTSTATTATTSATIGTTTTTSTTEANASSLTQ